jgi:hypothetical protein
MRVTRPDASVNNDGIGGRAVWGVDTGGGGGGGGGGGAPGEVEPRLLEKVGEGTQAGGESFADAVAEPFASSYVRFIFIGGGRGGECGSFGF